MITFSKLEKKGHLGNQLFQIASTIGIAKSNNQRFGFPKWSYSNFFQNELPVEKLEEFEIYKEETFHFAFKKFSNRNYDLEGWFQSEKYFDIDSVKYYFEFKKTFLDELKKKNQVIFEKKTILISIRRGDFVDHRDYFQLPINYYINALIDNFSDWKEKNLVVLSDDIDYCKFHFSFLDNVFFADNLSAIEQLGIASLCDDFIISNSTFSWWCAWLGEKKESIVVRPFHYFTEAKNAIDNDKDYFPKRWMRYNHLNKKIDLGNTVAVLQKENIIIEDYLRHYFSFINENKILLLDKLEDSFSKVNNNRVLLINDAIIPPLCIYNAIKYTENSAALLKGNFVTISKYFDCHSLKKQFDFGLFVKMMRHKLKIKKTNKLLFVFFSKDKLNTNFPIFNRTSSAEFKSIGFELFFSFSGKVKGFFEFEHYFLMQKRKWIVFFKTKIKKVIKKSKRCA
ncbi:alpha-1,2-fucosyltransferase [Flavobacterium aquiphilum]|uniref:alpha-1,2-fucosyltransferase n=1 Tax=Flavobacterium aquiphilum TaxID=3003261 RepID=UPI00247FD6FB|nr:alpha-1,2-fucosyltransferase [Flavobacterium aquiphilum]